MSEEQPRSRTARRAAEDALVRVVHHYGATPEFVLLGGLVPELLCGGSGLHHAGTTDIDVQVDLEIAAGSTNMTRLEEALANAEFSADPQKVWRWQTEVEGHKAVVKFELLADLDYAAAGAVVTFDGCGELGAVNLRGTGFAARDSSPRRLSARIGGVAYQVEVNVADLAGFLLAKVAAAYGRRKPKDWYDIAYVLLHNDRGGPIQAAEAVRDRFAADLVGATRTALDDLVANYETPDAQGPVAYASQVVVDHPEMNEAQLRADAVVAIKTFYGRVIGSQAVPE